MKTSGPDSDRVGIVVIGRNEGDRLLACLASLQGLGCAVAYVDSASRDGSVDRARPLCERVLELDPARPFSAARSRNEGFAALTSAHAAIEYVQFVDGDCNLLPGWLSAAAQALDADASRAIVVGPLQERRPDASIYNRLCALEWKSPSGDLTNCNALGGIMMVRAESFVRLGGFNEQVIAGEDSEFGVRAGNAGLKITKIDAPMATHDAGIEHFSQWWRRAVRSGHAIGQRFSLHGRGPTHDCSRERRSVLMWAGALPATVLALAPATNGLSFLLLGLYLLLGHRVARFRRRQGDDPADARLYARFVIIGKFAEGMGLLRFQFNRLVRRYRIIEYK